MYKKIILILLITLEIYAAQTYEKIEFKGLTQISEKVARETLNFKDNSYSNDEINKAIQKFYKFNYFTNISVTTENSTLLFTFVEKPFIAKIEMTGYKNREDDLNTLYRSMDIKKGTMFTEYKLKKAKTALLLSLEREGYVNSVVEVTIENINNNSVLLRFDVNKGDPITITKIDFRCKSIK